MLVFGHDPRLACRIMEIVRMLDLPGWLWAVIIAGVLVFGYFTIRNFLRDLKGLSEVPKTLMDSGAELVQGFNDFKATRTYSPKTEAYIEKITASEEGQFILNSGILSQEEIGNLSRLQLAKFLASTTQMVEFAGRNAFIASMPEFRKSLLKAMAKVKNH